MSLTDLPPSWRLPDPGVPFIVYGLWTEPGDSIEGVERLSIAKIPGGPLLEFAVGGSLARPLSYVEIDELPIVLALTLANVHGAGEWRFQYMGQDLSKQFGVPHELQPSPPRPQSPDELGAAAEAMLRESVGVGPDDPLPEPAGPLPPEERPAEPERFDPTRHMDLSTAEAPPPLPAPAAPGPAPSSNAQTAPVPPAPPPGRPLGAFGDQSTPFPH